MPPTPVVAALVALVVLIAVFVVLRLKKSSPAPEAPRFEPPRELAPQNHPATSAAPLPPAASAAPHPPHATSHAPTSGQFPAPTAPKTPAVEFAVAPPPIQQVVTPPPVAAPQFMAPAPTPLPVISAPPPTSPFVEEPQENTAALGAPPVAAPVVPEPAETPPPKPGAPAKPRTPLRSYSSIQDTDEEGQAAPPPARIDPPKPVAARVSEARLPATAKPAVPPPAKPVVPEPKVAAPAAAADKVATAKVPAAKSGEHDFSGLNPPAAAAPAPAAATPSAVPASAAQTAASAIAAKYMQPSNPATAELEKGDPRHAAARRLARLSVSEIKLYHEEEVKTGREAKDLWTRLQTDIGLARQTFESRVVAEVRDRFDYLLDEIIRQLAEGDASKLGAGAPALKTDGAPAAAAAPSAPVAEPAKAEARPKPVPEPVKSEPKAAPAPAAAAPVAAAPAAAPAAAAPVAEAAKPAGPSGVAARGLPANPETAELEKGDPRHAAARRLARLSVSEIKLYHEAEVTAGRENKDLWTRLTADISLATTTYEKRVDKEVRDRFDYLYDEILRQLAEGDAGKLGPGAPAPKKAEPPPAAAPAPAPAPAPAAAAPAPAAAPAAAAAPSAAAGIAAKYMQPSNPLTAELEKGDPRHAAARRFARLSVSEIKLYHEDEVKAGREAKDLWTRMGTDIGLAIQTYEKRVDKEVRERFDYLYDEILRQLAEGDAAKLGPGAPPPKP